MLLPLQESNTLYVIPLIDIHSATFATNYTQGPYCYLYGELEGNGLLLDSYLVDNLKKYVAKDSFDGQHEHYLPLIGIYIGLIHGGVLTRRGKLRPDATTLVTLHGRDTARSYNVGREWYFYEAQQLERLYTDASLNKHHRDLALESHHFHDEERTLNFATRCILGELILLGRLLVRAVGRLER